MATPTSANLISSLYPSLGANPYQGTQLQGLGDPGWTNQGAYGPSLPSGYQSLPSGSDGGYHPVNGSESTLSSVPQQTGGQTSGGGQQAGPAAAAYNPFQNYINPAPLNGQIFNLKDPGSRMEYFNANAKNLQDQYMQSIAQMQKTYGENYADAAATNSSQMGTLRQGQYNVRNGQGTGQADQYARGLTKSIAELYNGYGTGLTNIHNSYQSLSPNAYQSSEGQDQQYAQSQYAKGNSDLQSQAQATVGSHFLQDGTLDPNSQYGQQYAGYGRQMSDVDRTYNQYLSDQHNAQQLAVQGANNAVGDGEGKIAGLLGTYDQYQNAPIQGYNIQAPDGTNAVTHFGQGAGNQGALTADQINQNSQNAVSGYGSSGQGARYAPGSVQTYQPYNVPQVNLAQYSPFTSAGQLGAAPGSSFNGQGVGGGNPSGLPQQTPLQQGLGYTPGSVQGSYAQQFLKGGAVVANQ